MLAFGQLIPKSKHMCYKLISFRSTWKMVPHGKVQMNMEKENVPISNKRGAVKKLNRRGSKKMKGSKSYKKDLLSKLSNVNQGVVDLVEEVCDLQGQLSAVTEERDRLLLTVGKLREENGSLKAKKKLPDPEENTDKDAIIYAPEVLHQEDNLKEDQQVTDDVSKENNDRKEHKDGVGSRDALTNESMDEHEDLTGHVGPSKKSNLDFPRRVLLHEMGEKLKCARCPYESYYTSKALLKRHVKEVHSRTHSKSEHSNLRQISPPICLGENWHEKSKGQNQSEQKSRFPTRLRMGSWGPKKDGEFAPPQQVVGGDGSFNLGNIEVELPTLLFNSCYGNIEGNGHNNGEGGGRGNRDGESGDDINLPSGKSNSQLAPK